MTTDNDNWDDLEARVAKLERKVKTLNGATQAALQSLRQIIIYLNERAAEQQWLDLAGDGLAGILTDDESQPVDPIQPPDDE